jgi:hypothetical protein
MLKRLTIALALFFVLATGALAQVVMPGAQPNLDFPAPTGPGTPRGIPSALAACNASVRHDQNGYPIRQLVRDCMYSKGYSVIYQNNCYQSSIPNKGWYTNTPKEVADCLSPPDNVSNNSYSFFPTPWQQRVPPVAFDPAAPGPKLLLLVKELADNGQLDGPTAIAEILHLPLTLSTHQESGPQSCSASSDQSWDSSDDYTIEGNTWFHALPSGTKLIIDQHPVDFFPFGPPPAGPKYVPLGDPMFTYTITSNASCGDPSPRDGIGAGIIFDSIPAYACISDQLVRTIFPPGPADELPRVIDGLGPDIAYFHNDTHVYFSLTGPAREIRQPAKQLSCLKTISIDTFYKFGVLHKADFTGKHPTPDNIASLPGGPSAKTLPSNPGMFLLKTAKALADSPNITNPVAASAILHMPFTLTGYREGGQVSCKAIPQGYRYNAYDYDTNTTSWFQTFHYGVIFHGNCTPSPADWVDFGISFSNISAYACVSAQQIKSVFTSAHPPSRAESDLGPDLVYESAYTWAEFRMAKATGAASSSRPVCLDQIQFYSIADLKKHEAETE